MGIADPNEDQQNFFKFIDWSDDREYDADLDEDFDDEDFDEDFDTLMTDVNMGTDA